MEILPEVKKIISRKNLKPIQLPNDFNNLYQYLNSFPELKKNFKSSKNENYFMEKYKKYIPVGWYGFSIGEPIIPEWCEIIDNILELCVNIDSNFEIHQIKIKFGGIRFYVDTQVIKDIFDVECYIEKTLYDKMLIY